MCEPPNGGADCPAYLICTRADKLNFSSVSPIKINNSITQQVGKVKAIRKTKDGLLIQTFGIHQTNRALQVTRLIDVEVSFTLHQSLNYVRGVIRHPEVTLCSSDELITELSSQGIKEVRRLDRRNAEGNPTPTSTAILTFMSPKLPEYVFLGYHRVPVRPFFNNPRRCLNCQCYGHLLSSCKDVKRCVCGGSPHPDSVCSENLCCPNCQGPHRADSKTCPSYVRELEIEKLRTSDHISYFEARRRIMARTPTKPFNVVANNAAPPSLLEHLRPLLQDIVKNVVLELFQALHIFPQPTQPIQAVPDTHLSGIPESGPSDDVNLTQSPDFIPDLMTMMTENEQMDTPGSQKRPKDANISPTAPRQRKSRKKS